MQAIGQTGRVNLGGVQHDPGEIAVENGIVCEMRAGNFMAGIRLQLRNLVR